jgi:hypothetical protein
MQHWWAKIIFVGLKNSVLGNAQIQFFQHLKHLINGKS